MAICGGLQRWLSKLAYHAMLAQRSSGGGEKKMSCAVAWISCPRWTKMLLDSKERVAISTRLTSRLASRTANNRHTTDHRRPNHRQARSLDSASVAFLLLFMYL